MSFALGYEDENGDFTVNQLYESKEDAERALEITEMQLCAAEVDWRGFDEPEFEIRDMTGEEIIRDDTWWGDWMSVKDFEKFEKEVADMLDMSLKEYLIETERLHI